MAKTSEPKLGLAVMQILAASPDGEATVRTLIKEAPNYIKLTAEDKEPSLTRPAEQGAVSDATRRTNVGATRQKS